MPNLAIFNFNFRHNLPSLFNLLQWLFQKNSPELDADFTPILLKFIFFFGLFWLLNSVGIRIQTNPRFCFKMKIKTFIFLLLIYDLYSRFVFGLMTFITNSSLNPMSSRMALIMFIMLVFQSAFLFRYFLFFYLWQKL